MTIPFFDKFPDAIPGIYNYCDRWCERCNFKDRCGNYQFRMKLDALVRETMGPEDAEVIDLQSSIHIIADPFSGSPDEATAESLDVMDFDRLRRRDEKIASHPVNALALKYSNAILEIVPDEPQTDFLNGIVLDAELADQLRPTQPVDLFTYLSNYHEPILFLSTLLHSKTERAMFNWYEIIEDGDPDGFIADDMNGTAKLLLVVVDELLEEWMKVKSYDRAFEETANRFFDDLLSLRELLENQFPSARSYIRKGLDDQP